MPENLVSRDGFSRPVPRQPAHLQTQAESGAYLRDSSRVPRRRSFMKPPYAIGSGDGFSRPVPRQPAHLHTQAESGAYLRDSSRVPRRRPFMKPTYTPSGQSRVYRVTQLRTDGVHCRESASTGPVNLKVVPNECCLGRSPWT